MEIKTIPNQFPKINTTIILTTPISGICPESNEPQEGSYISITYHPKSLLIELHAIEIYLQEIQKGTEPLDMETLIQMIAQDSFSVVGQVEVTGKYLLQSGLGLSCTCRISNLH